jgi:predicted DNA-binding transcriptional regulator AlpA
MIEAKEPTPRLAYRLNEIAQAIGISRRTLERERSAGRFPPPDRMVGKAPLWRPATLESWLSDQSKN